MPEFYAPAFRVQVNGANVQLELSKNIEQISVVTMPGTMDTFNMTLINAYPEMPWTHGEGNFLFNEGNAVKIELGYVDDVQAVFDGEITKLSPTFPESGPPTIGIEGHTRMHYLTLHRQTRTFRDVTDKQIVERIARDLGLEVEVEDDGVKHDYVMQANQTDFEFLSERATASHSEVAMQGRKLTYKPGREAENEVFTLVWGHAQLGMAPHPNTLPLRTFTPTMNALNQVQEVEVRGYDKRTKQPIVERAGTPDQITKMGASRSGSDVSASAFRRQRREIRVDTAVSTAEKAKQRAKAAFNDRVMQFLKGSGTTIGAPALRSGSVVKILGVGPRFSGRYYLKEVTHTIGSGGYTTSFNAERNAVE
jgi:uncharacterized protein